MENQYLGDGSLTTQLASLNANVNVNLSCITQKSHDHKSINRNLK